MGMSVMQTYDDYINLAQQFELYEQFDMALKYFMEAYSIDRGSKLAEMGIERTRAALAKKVFYKTSANYKLTEGKLELRRGMLLFIGKNGSETEYWIDDIENPGIKFGRLIFDYRGKTIEGYSCARAKSWVSTINGAKEGRYPATDGVGSSSLEKYVRENFTVDTVNEATLYFMDLTGCDSTDARIVVQRILG